jgi:hypothetical protein
MKYAKIKDGVVEKFPYEMSDLQEDNPSTIYHSDDFYNIFPTTVQYELGYRLVEVIESEQPKVLPNQVVTKSFAELENKQWVERWQIADLNKQEYAEKVLLEWKDIRALRSKMLSECDWTQISDSPVNDSDWHPYRQALRDITLQPDPFNIVWPEPPK